MASETIQDLLSMRYSDRLTLNTVIHLTEGVIGVFGNIIVLVMYCWQYCWQERDKVLYPCSSCGWPHGMSVKRGPISAGQHDAIYLPWRPSLQNSFFLDDNVWWTLRSSDFRYCSAEILNDLPSVLSADDTKVLLNRFCDLCLFFSLGYAAPVLKFGGFIEIKRWLKRKTDNKTRIISFTTRSCHFDDGSHGPRVMVPYFGTLLVLSFMNIIASSGLYIPVTKTIYRTLSSNKNHGNRVSRMLDGDTPISSKDTHSTSIEKIKMSEIPQQSQNTKSKRPGPEIKAGPGIKFALETDREQKARKRISVMFLIIIIVYVVSYLTSLTTQVYDFLSTERMSGYRWNIHMFCLRLNLLNHIANPYIYWFYDVKFRKELQKLCCKRLKRDLCKSRGAIMMNEQKKPIFILFSC